MNASDIRFELKLDYFPNQDTILQSCQIIYNSRDKNLIASMNSTPYIVGRSFTREEQENISEQLRALGVGFRFKSKPPYEEEINFDPRSTPAETETTVFQVPWKGIALTAGGLLALALIFFGLSKIDWTPESSQSRSESPPPSQAKSIEPEAKMDQSKSKAQTKELQSFDASITRINPRVEFREANSLLWRDAKVDQGLQRDDAIRTYAKAWAVIRYQDSSFVRIRENTLLTIGETLNLDTATERELELKDGSLQARLQAAAEPSSLSIKTSQGTLQISNQQDQKPSNTQISTSLENGRLEVAVSEGKASFQPSSKDSKPLELKQNQKVTAVANEPPVIEEYSPLIVIISPVDSEKLILKESEKNVFEFVWEDLGPGFEYEWKIYLDAAKSNLVLSQKTSNNRILLNYLDPGSLYWQVEAHHDATFYSSPLQRVYVEKHND